MTDFFEHQRRARKKSQRVLVVFFLLMLFLLYVFNLAVYWIVGGVAEDPYSSSYSTTVYKYQTDAIPSSSLPEAKSILDFREQPVTHTTSEILQKIFFIHPHTAHIQWAIIGVFLLLFMGGFLFKVFQYYSYPRSVVQSMVYREVFYHSNVSEAERRLLNIVEEMCISAGIPVVKTYLLVNEQSINAFTAGYDLRTAHIVVTQGALDHLNRDEMQAVIAHEVGHITSADVSVNTLLLSCIFSMTIIMTIGVRILRSSGRSSSSSSNKRGGGGAGQILLIAVLFVCIGALGAYCGRALQSMFSRKREFLADSLAVQFTRNPSALASALAKIRDQIFVKMNHFEAANISHMCFVSSAHQGLFGVFATHPPIEDRIAVLDKEYLGVHPETEKLFTKKETQKVEKKKNTINIPFDHLGPQMTAQRVIADSALLFDPYLSHLEGEKILGRLQKQPEVEQALHTPEDFKYPVWGLFLSQNETTKTKQIAVLKKHYGQDFSEKKLAESILPDEECVELINSVVSIALARVQSLDKEAKAVFLGSMQELMMADEVIEPFEHLIYSCFMANNLLEKEVSRIQLEHLRSLFFLCVKLNKTSEQHELQIYKQTLEKYTGVKQEVVAPPKSIELGDTVLLLRQLRAKSLQARREVLVAVKCALFSDGKVTHREYETYRAISMALDIPAPLVSDPL